MKKMAIVHYMPLEFYPPVMNLLNSFKAFSEFDVHVYTTRNNKNRKLFERNYINKINRFPFPNSNSSSLKRLIKYFIFNFYSFIKLVAQRPNIILYYESFSAGPVFWYLKLFGSKQTKLYIHYHEYFPPSWYTRGMRLVKVYHNYERGYLYNRADWISQTNEDRIRLFLQDEPYIDKDKMKVLPNYPPSNWIVEKKDNLIVRRTIKSVYVGTVSLQYSYIREYCAWVEEQNGDITLDIYSFNFNQETRQYLVGLNSKFIRFFDEGIDYYNLPKVLINYDVGLILYKGLTENYLYNAPNKLFEYLACGLDVWFSDKLLGIYPYLAEDTLPKVIKIDFENIITFDINKALDRRDLKLRPSYFFAENVYSELLRQLS